MAADSQSTAERANSFADQMVERLGRGPLSDEEVRADMERSVTFQQWCDERRRPQAMPVGSEPTWLIRYADQDICGEIFAGAGAEEAARRRFDQQRGHWSISLYQEVARG